MSAMIYWEKTIILRLQSPVFFTVSIVNAKSAAKLLLNQWPEKTGRSYRRAVINCLGAIRGQVSQEAAQWAFTVAVMEAAIPFEIKDRLEMEIAEICQALLSEEGVSTEASPKSTYPGQVLQGKDVQAPIFWWPKPQAGGQSVR